MSCDSLGSNENGVDDHELGTAETNGYDALLGTPTPSTPLHGVGVEESWTPALSDPLHGVRVEESRASSLLLTDIDCEPSMKASAVANMPVPMSVATPYTFAAQDGVSKEFSVPSDSLFVTPEPIPCTATQPNPPAPILRTMKKEEPEDDEEDHWMFGSSVDEIGEDTEIQTSKKDVKLKLKDTMLEEPLNLKSNYDPVVEVYVGAKGEKFDMHEHLLCHMSGYFLDHFRNGRLVPIREPELLKANPEFFGMFQRYCYSGQIVLPKTPTKARGPAQYLLGAYYLAEKLAARRFKNAVMDQLSRELVKKNTPSDKFVKWSKNLFGKVNSGPLRRLFANTFYLIHKNHYGELSSNSSHGDMKHELLKLSLGPAKDRPKQKELKINAPKYCANYHEHDAFNPSWICQAERQVKDPFLIKTPATAKSGRGSGLLNNFRDKARKEIEDDERHDAGLKKSTKKRKTPGGAIDTAYVQHDDEEDEDY